MASVAWSSPAVGGGSREGVENGEEKKGEVAAAREGKGREAARVGGAYRGEQVGEARWHGGGGEGAAVR